MRGFLALTGWMIKRQRRLGAALFVLCLLAWGLAAGAGAALASRDADAPVLTVLLTGESEEAQAEAETLAGLLGRMGELASWCRFSAAGPDEARRALAAGEAAGVVWLPEDFLASILNGENRSPTLETAPGLPLEGALTAWMGQTAAALLTDSQAGIYAALETYDQIPDPPLTRDQAVAGVNLAFARAVLERGRMFRTETLAAAALPPAEHYALGTLACLLLLCAPLFWPCLGGGEQAALWQRARAVGLSPLAPAGAGLVCAFGLYVVLFFLPLAVYSRAPLACLAPAALAALTAAGFAGLCCGPAASRSRAGALALGLAGASALAAGCVLPPVLLPGWLWAVGRWTPPALLRTVLAVPLGHRAPAAEWAALAVWALALCAAALVLGARRARRRANPC